MNTKQKHEIEANTIQTDIYTFTRFHVQLKDYTTVGANCICLYLQQHVEGVTINQFIDQPSITKLFTSFFS